MRKLLFLLLMAGILCVSAAAYEVPQDFTDLTLEEAIADFIEYYQLTDENFSISFYNTVTGESYDFNEYHFAIAASTYKLPLNMYFYELEAQGLIDPNATFRHTGMSLAEVHKESILYSNNEVSEAMIGYFKSSYEYKEAMRKYSTIALEDLSPTFYETNHSCTRMMMDTLKYLYAHENEFSELIGYMKDAMPGQYFQAGVTEYEVAHKYGQVDGFINDVAIIYTPQPILLAVYTQGIYGTGVCADAARLVTNYTVWNIDQVSATAFVRGAAERTVQAVQLLPQAEVTQEQPPITTEGIPFVPTTGFAEDFGSVMDLAIQQVRASKDGTLILEEPPVEEPPVEETPGEEEPQQSAEETQQPEEEDETEVPEQSTSVKKEESKLLWVFVGIGSLILLIAIPWLLRRRY